ncbi:MAG: methyltransferase domain-containing protein [Hyphomicrobiales bacterium]|nr:methyltransferase domain-containing protein [Hyphomicrobiales bacterium]
MKFTGERYVPQMEAPEISYEHWHRYLYASQFVAGKDVLDVASGEGFGAHLLAMSARRVVGVDVDPEAVAHAARTYQRPNLEFRCGSAVCIPLQDARSFDVVVSFETIEHLDAEQQMKFGDEIKRLLKPGGQAIISTPDKLYYSDQPKYNNEFHRHEFYEREFRAFLGDLFRHVSVFEQRVYPVSYIWAQDRAARPPSVFQIAYTDGRFAPVSGDRKVPLYLIAVCSDTAYEVPSSSLLLDVSARATQVRLEQLSEREHAVERLAAHAREQQSVIERLQEQSREHELLDELRDQLSALRDQIEAGRQEHAALEHVLAGKAELERQLLTLSAAKEAAEGEAVTLRGTVAEQAERLRSLATQADDNAAHEQELRAMLVDTHAQLLRRDAEIEATLGAALQADAPGSPGSIRHGHLLQKIRQVARDKLPANARVLVVSLGDAALLELDGRHAAHFPQSDDGAYADYTLADGAAAIAHLETLRERGADFLLIPRHTRRWLRAYTGFQEYLERRYRVVARQPDVGLILDLRLAPENRSDDAAGITPMRGNRKGPRKRVGQ